MWPFFCLRCVEHERGLSASLRDCGLAATSVLPLASLPPPPTLARSMWAQSADDLGSFQGLRGVDVGSIWGRFGPIWGRFGDHSGSTSGRHGVDMGSARGRFGSGLTRGRSGSDGRSVTERVLPPPSPAPVQTSERVGRRAGHESLAGSAHRAPRLCGEMEGSTGAATTWPRTQYKQRQ